MGRLIHLVYASAAVKGLTESEVENILKISVTNNYASDITGMLLFAEGSFLQVLEGDEDVVTPLFESIKQDKRHWDVLLLYLEPVEQRYFGDWSMGVASLDYISLMEIPGCKDFFASGQKLTQLREGTAKKLLTAFRQGELRRHLR